jgi:hypothetical protein
MSNDEWLTETYKQEGRDGPNIELLLLQINCEYIQNKITNRKPILKITEKNTSKNG